MIVSVRVNDKPKQQHTLTSQLSFLVNEKLHNKGQLAFPVYKSKQAGSDLFCFKRK